MKYRHLRTGTVIEVASRLCGGGWTPVEDDHGAKQGAAAKAEAPKQAAPAKGAAKPAAKKPAAKKR